MNPYSAFILLIFLSLGQSGLSFHHIGACKYYDHDEVAKCNLTLICDSGTGTNNLFQSSTSQCSDDSRHFEKYWIGTVDFENCAQPEIPSVMFDVYSSLHTLNISNIGLKQNQVGFLAKAKPLKFIYASNNAIERISENMFGESDELITLDFSNNKIEHFHSNAFPVTNRIEMINLSFNNISELAVDSFERLIHVKKIFITNNQITDIPSFLFHKTNNAIEIDLTGNNIQIIDDFAFVRSMDLVRLNLSKNQMTTLSKKMLESLSKLEYLNISFNQIKYFEPNLFNNSQKLRQLDLSSNLLKKLDKITFIQLVNLQYLNLSHNELTDIANETFSTVENLQTLDLSFNRLKQLNVGILPSQRSQLELLSIGHNQLHEFIGFNSSHMPNVKILGVDSNKFNCSQIDQIMYSFSGNHFHSFSIRVNCSNYEEHNVMIDIPSITEFWNESTTSASHKTSNFDTSTDKMEETTKATINSKTKEKSTSVTMKNNDLNISENETPIIIKMTWTNLICLLVVVVIIIIIKKLKQRKRKQSNHSNPSQVIYRSDDADVAFSNLIESRVFPETKLKFYPLTINPGSIH